MTGFSLKSHCKYKERCAERHVIEMFLNLAGRSLGSLPNCEGYNMFYEDEETNNGEEPS